MQEKNGNSLKTEYGGKGAVLMQLQQLGYPVPPPYIIPVSFFRKFMNVPDPEKDFSSYCSSLLQEIADLWGTGRLFAVRSSSVAEDGNSHSYAGQFTTLLNVPFSDLPDAVKTVWSSADSERVTGYQRHSGLAAGHEMAVIIQEMIPATAAGVAFGINPLTQQQEIVINAVAGLGDKLVDGTASAVTYTVQGHKISGLENTLLDSRQIEQITACITSLETHFKIPQDIEFAFVAETFYLLQSRPVTTISNQEQRIIWDNSNIIESYPGLTLPLTFSFIEKMYEAVYRQFSLVLGISPAKVARHSHVFANMLGLLNGRVYYNLNSWYRSLALLPGYSINAAFMEKMMGVKEKPDIDPGPEERQPKLRAWRDVVVAVYGILRNLRHARKEKQTFITAFDTVYNQYRQQDFTTMPLHEIWAAYSSFEALMLKEWKAPLVNDFFAMIYFGLLQKQGDRYWPDNKELHNQLIAASEDIITTQPLKQLPAIAAAVNAVPELKAACVHESPEAFHSLLHQPAHQQILGMIHEYTDLWGERCVAELKLETVTYSQAPEKLLSLIQSYVTNGIFTYSGGLQSRHQRTAATATAMAFFKGKYIRKKIFAHILRQARYFVSNRENLRYYRTRGFGMVRKMMMGMGVQLHKAGLTGAVRDVFYLKLEELKALATAPQQMQGIIAARKEDYLLYESMPLPGRIVTHGKPQQAILLPPEHHEDRVTDTLQGIPCSQGIVRSKICKVNHTSALQSLNGGILTTYATDPGYVVLFATAAGILTERGSLLSHAAIVSREMGIPCIVGIEGLMDTLQDGDEVLMDGSTGVVKIIKKA